MTRKVVLLMSALALLFTVSLTPAATPSAQAQDYCDRAQAAKWLHPGLNLQCFWQIIWDWFAAGGYMEPTRD